MPVSARECRREMPDFLGFGHSHIVAIAKGCYELQQSGAPFAGQFFYLYDPEFTPALTSGGGGRRLHPRILEKIETLAPQFVALSIGGNEHNALSMVQLNRRFDFISSERPDLPLETGAEILPEAVITEAVREWMEDTFSTIRAFREATQLPLVQLEAPPPLPREQVLAYPKEFFRAAVDLRKLSSEALRHKMWRIQAKLFRELCEHEDVLYISAPTDLIGEDGMLARPAWGQDASHANSLFGRRMVEEMMARFSPREFEEANDG